MACWVTKEKLLRKLDFVGAKLDFEDLLLVTRGCARITSILMAAHSMLANKKLIGKKKRGRRKQESQQSWSDITCGTCNQARKGYFGTRKNCRASES